MRSLREAFRPEALPQVLLVVVVLVLTALIVASAANYASLAQAHALPSLAATASFRFTGLDATGNLSENGSVVFSLTATVTNPSSRVLRFEQLIYSAWIEDGPTEAGIPNLGRSDETLTNATGTHQFFLAFIGPVGLNPQPVPVGGNGSVVLTLTLTKAAGLAEFEAIQNITAYARAHGAAPSAIPWNVYTWVSLTIDGVPLPSSASSADYLRDNARVILQTGNDLTVLGVPGFGA